MASTLAGTALRQFLHRLACGPSGELSDGELLAQFHANQDEDAFAALVRRHGPMVVGVCQRVLPHVHDAEDAFQATFLILARKAASLDRSRSLGNWLYTVARNMALKVQAGTARRWARERQVADMAVGTAPHDVSWEEVRQVLDAELGRLPEKYRAPLVLCYLEGKTNEAAAQELGWPSGSMARRLERARELLRQRLTRRGLALSTGLLTTLLTEKASAAVSTALVNVTSKTALLFAAGKLAATGPLASRAAALAADGLSSVVPGKLTIVAAVLLALGIAGAWAGTTGQQGAAEKRAASARGDRPADRPAAPALQADPECPPHLLTGKATLIAKPEAFKTLVNPACSHCIDEAKRRKGELRDDDRVLSWIRGYSDGGAIPYRFFLNPYRVISDTYGVFVYDPDAGYARGFAPSLDFRFHGWRNGIMVMQHKDGTLYSCLSGGAFEGPKKGTRLKAVPTLVSDWGLWLKTYPHAVAYHMYEKYQPVELPTKMHPDSCHSRGPADKRMEPTTPIFGVAEGKTARAYPLDVLAKNGLVRETVDGKDRVLLWFAPTKTAAAYQPLAAPPPKQGTQPRTVTLDIDPKDGDAPFVDRETGSRWDIAGRAVDGKLKGWTLSWLDGVQVKWFAWAAEYPETSIYGK